uniref:Uncharacterized protein n=1 Tax=Triticum urartu TaxID=4572 RepID=A0A8R7P2F6_TRIUA
MMMVFVSVPFLNCRFGAIFKLRYVAYNQRNKTASVISVIFLFYFSGCL